MAEPFHISLDESGKLDDSEVVAFGGVAGTADAMEAFSDRWFAQLRLAGIPYLSMKEAMHCSKSWKKFKGDLPHRDEVLSSLARIILDVSRMSVPVTTAKFRALPQEERERLGNPQYHAFEACVRLALDKAPANSPFLIECDLSEEYAEKCVTLFHKVRSRDAELKQRAVGLLFMDDQCRAPLQAADMIAYCCRANALRTTMKLRPVIEELLSIFPSPNREVYQYEGPLARPGEGRIRKPAKRGVPDIKG